MQTRISNLQTLTGCGMLAAASFLSGCKSEKPNAGSITGKQQSSETVSLPANGISVQSSTYQYEDQEKTALPVDWDMLDIASLIPLNNIDLETITEAELQTRLQYAIDKLGTPLVTQAITVTEFDHYLSRLAYLAGLSPDPTKNIDNIEHLNSYFLKYRIRLLFSLVNCQGLTNTYLYNQYSPTLSDPEIVADLIAFNRLQQSFRNYYLTELTNTTKSEAMSIYKKFVAEHAASYIPADFAITAPVQVPEHLVIEALGYDFEYLDEHTAVQSDPLSRISLRSGPQTAASDLLTQPPIALNSGNAANNELNRLQLALSDLGNPLGQSTSITQHEFNLYLINLLDKAGLLKEDGLSEQTPQQLNSIIFYNNTYCDVRDRIQKLYNLTYANGVTDRYLYQQRLPIVSETQAVDDITGFSNLVTTFMTHCEYSRQDLSIRELDSLFNEFIASQGNNFIPESLKDRKLRTMTLPTDLGVRLVTRKDTEQSNQPAFSKLQAPR